MTLVPSPAEIRRTALTLNPLRQIPVLRDGALLAAVAKRYGRTRNWLKDLSVKAAYVQRSLSIAAGEVAFGPALARGMHFGVPTALRSGRARRVRPASTDQGDATLQADARIPHRS